MKYFTITPQTTPEDLKTTYRTWAMKLHPDTGGSKEEFQELKLEYEQALKQLATQPEYGYLTDSDTFKKFMAGIDDMFNQFEAGPLSEFLTAKAIRFIDNLKLPPALQQFEILKPMAKAYVAEKLSNPQESLLELEKFIRKQQNKNQQEEQQ